MSVLILAHEVDVTADRVVQALQRRGTEVHRIDLGWFPAQLGLSAELRGHTWVGTLTTPHRRITLEHLHAIWYRAPSAFEFPSGLSAAETQHAYLEAKFGLGGVLWGLPVLWVNHPARAADACYKPLQLAVAARCGLTTPATLVTNEPEPVRQFATGGETVTKMFGANHIAEDDTRKVAFTRRVTSEDLADLRGIEITAHQFQRWVDKQVDVRVIAIGRDLFAFAIHTSNPDAQRDFRLDYDSHTYEWVALPSPVADGIHAVLAELGLVYAALDFSISADGEWVFLGDINPGGQFGFLDMPATGAPLTDTMADLLTRGYA